MEDKQSASYQSCKKLAKYLNLDYDGIAEAIDENPDAKDVAQAMIMMGVVPDSDNESDIEYLYRYFELLYNTQDDKYKKKILRGFVVAIEAAASAPWFEFADAVVGVDRFGLSGPGDVVYREMGFDADAIAADIIKKMK